MKIAELVPSLEHTAPIFVATDLARGFARRGHDVTLFHLAGVADEDPGVPVRRLDWRRSGELRGFDVVHSHLLRPDLLSSFRLPRSADGAKRVSTLHNYVYEDVRNTHGPFAARIVAALWCRAWRRMDARVVLSEDAARYYARWLPGQPCVSIANGRSPHGPSPLPADECERLAALRARFTVIGTNALVTPRKGLDQVVRALSGLPDYAFVLVGDGAEVDTLRRLAGRLGVADRFHPLGFRTNARDYLDHYDLYVMPSRFEGLGLAMLEAAAAGLPIVCSRLPVFREVFDESQAVFFTLDDIEGLQDALRLGWQRRSTLGPAAKARFEARYSLDGMVTSYLALFERLVGACGSAEGSRGP